MTVLIVLLSLVVVVLLIVRRLAMRDPYKVWLAKWERGKRADARGVLRCPVHDHKKGQDPCSIMKPA